jgi:DNA-binding NarL/FixJ family response regulator
VTPTRVVVGEDHPIFREGLIRVLEGDGFEVVAAAGTQKTWLGRPARITPMFWSSTFRCLDLVGDRAEGVGYLLKDKVGDVALFTDALRRVAAKGSALDPDVVALLVGRKRRSGPLDRLTKREREVLSGVVATKMAIDAGHLGASPTPGL